MSPDPFAWISANIGPCDFTGTEVRCIRAIVAVLEVYAVSREPTVLRAFHALVATSLQYKNRVAAYHIIAMVLDWDDREKVWEASGLPSQDFGTCEFEPVNR